VRRKTEREERGSEEKNGEGRAEERETSRWAKI
jgi:hypothetical protein